MFFWNDWEVGDTGTISDLYGAVVKKHDHHSSKFSKQLEANPWNRLISSPLDYQAFETDWPPFVAPFELHVCQSSR